MDRLTRKHDDGVYVVEMQEHDTEANARKTLMENFNKCCNKLGKLEDIEEEIGMSLEDFYKCIIHNEESFYIIEESEDTKEFEIIEVFKDDEYMHMYVNGFIFAGNVYDKDERCYEIPFKSYGKSMFLTYEEAEKALKKIEKKS